MTPRSSCPCGHRFSLLVASQSPSLVLGASLSITLTYPFASLVHFSQILHSYFRFNMSKVPPTHHLFLASDTIYVAAQATNQLTIFQFIILPCNLTSLVFLRLILYSSALPIIMCQLPLPGVAELTLTVPSSSSLAPFQFIFHGCQMDLLSRRAGYCHFCM